MKDTQGNNITEEEFTKDIGHEVVDPEEEKIPPEITLTSNK